MTTLNEIEAAVETLTPEQQVELMLFLAARLGAREDQLPQPRDIPPEQIDAWVAEDEAAMRRIREGT